MEEISESQLEKLIKLSLKTKKEVEALEGEFGLEIKLAGEKYDLNRLILELTEMAAAGESGEEPEPLDAAIHAGIRKLEEGPEDWALGVKRRFRKPGGARG